MIDSMVEDARLRIAAKKDDPDYIRLSKSLLNGVDSIRMRFTDVGRSYLLMVEEGVLSGIEESEGPGHIHLDLTSRQVSGWLERYRNKDYAGLLNEASGLKVPVKYKMRGVKVGTRFLMDKAFRESVLRLLK